MKATATSDDVVASFSSSGVVGVGGTEDPDLVAPGKSIISLAVPGSYVDQAYGASGAVTGGYLRGSGTSQATAVASGAAALVLQQHPAWTNIQVKALLTGTARPLTAGTLTRVAQGKGTLDLAKALQVTSVTAAEATPTPPAPAPGKVPAGPPTWSTTAWSSGGSRTSSATRLDRHPGLQAHRRHGLGRRDLERPHVVRRRLQRQQLGGHDLERPDVVGVDVVQRGLVRADVVGRTWSAGTWNGRTWSGDGWSANTWSSAGWS
jgi:serine protease AprX